MYYFVIVAFYGAAIYGGARAVGKDQPVVTTSSWLFEVIAGLVLAALFWLLAAGNSFWLPALATALIGVDMLDDYLKIGKPPIRRHSRVAVLWMLVSFTQIGIASMLLYGQYPELTTVHLIIGCLSAITFFGAIIAGAWNIWKSHREHRAAIDTATSEPFPGLDKNPTER